MRNLILILSLVTFSFLIHCSHKSSPTEPQETADLSVNMLLKPATDGKKMFKINIYEDVGIDFLKSSLSIRKDERAFTMMRRKSLNEIL